MAFQFSVFAGIGSYPEARHLAELFCDSASLPRLEFRGPINNLPAFAGANKEKAMTLFRPLTRSFLLAATALALAGCGGMMTSAKPSNMVDFKGTLSGANEVPAKQ